MSANEKSKLVSIIVPAYNVEKYIKDCLDSLLKQTYRNIEIIVVDDGSHDRTFDIISELMNKDSRIRGFHQENKGVSAARNLALDKACGDYIQFVDGDDYITADAVEKLVTVLEDNNAEWVNFQYHREDEDGKDLGDYDFTKGYMDLSDEDRKLTFITDVLIEYKVGYEIWDKLYVSRLIKNNNLRFDEKCHMGEDLEFNICYSLLAKSLICIKDRLYNYRIRGGSAMQSMTALSENFDERLLLIQGIEKPIKAFFSEYGEKEFGQIFYKLMLYACKGHSIGEIAATAAASPYRIYFTDHLAKALGMKDIFNRLFPDNLAMIYFRSGYYILTSLNGSIKGKLYFVVYNLYRRLRGREVISEWKPV
jgi:glycosyltransferase involved in cell wall biosynthesis